MAQIVKMLSRKMSMKMSAPKEEEEEDEDENMMQKIPEPNLRLSDGVLSTLLNGTWQEQRVVITTELISFALNGDEHELDRIPLAETDYIQNKNGLSSDIGVVEMNVVQIATSANGYNSGRTYYLQAQSKEATLKLGRDLQKLLVTAKERAYGKTLLLKLQYKFRRIYDSSPFQGAVAFFISANFVVTIVESQYINDLTNDDGTDTDLGAILNNLNLFFTLLFTAELLINAFAHWFREFVGNVWSWLDMFVVAMSIIALILTDEPTGIVRIIRALRVIRIFGRLKALKRIIAAVSAALNPVVNVFLILFMLVGIAAIIGVTLFRDIDPDDFDVFNNAFLTMFHITAGDPWPESLPKLNSDGSINLSVALFMTGYTIIVNWVILQVSVAVLLDNFISASSRADHEELLIREAEKQRDKQVKNPLEPLLLKYARDFSDSEDLTEKFQKLYQALDADNSGGLSCKEFCAAMKKLVCCFTFSTFVEGCDGFPYLQDFKPRIHMSDSDFNVITENGALCDERGQLGYKEFENVMRKQITQLTQSRLATLSSTDYRSQLDTDFMQFGSLKLLLMHQLAMEKEQAAIRKHLENLTEQLCMKRSSGQGGRSQDAEKSNDVVERTRSGAANSEAPPLSPRENSKQYVRVLVEDVARPMLEKLFADVVAPLRNDIADLTDVLRASGVPMESQYQNGDSNGVKVGLPPGWSVISANSPETALASKRGENLAKDLKPTRIWADLTILQPANPAWTWEG